MKATPETIRKRMPVWSALSDLFLDTQLDQDDLAYIARVLHASPYTNLEIWAILRYEVYPVCIGNMTCVAGEWANFPDDWLMQYIAPRCDKRSRFIWPMWNFKLIEQDWQTVCGMLNEHRGTKCQSASR